MRRRKTTEQLPKDAAWPDVADEIVARDELETALAALPPLERAAVLLVDANGFDYATAARILGVPPGTIASRLNRARASLRATLAPEGAEHARR